MDWLTTMRNNKELTKYVSAFLLGDSSISVDKRDWKRNGNAVFECTQIETHLDYLEWIKSVLEDITSIKISKAKDAGEFKFPQGHTSKTKAQFRVRSSRHPFFNPFRERMYGTGKKSIDPHYLTLMDWESLAIWYMDDGYISNTIKRKDGKEYPQVILGLCTNCFTYGDNWLLKKAIKEKFDLEFNIQEDRKIKNLTYRLICRAKDIQKFLDGVEKYIQPSFKYKLINSRTESSLKKDEEIV